MPSSSAMSAGARPVVADPVPRVRQQDRIVAHLDSDPVAVGEGPRDPALRERLLHGLLQGPAPDLRPGMLTAIHLNNPE